MSESAADAVLVRVEKGAHLRKGVAVPPPDGVDNLILTVATTDNYPAYKQCPGQFVNDGAQNFWWVQITVGSETGWVSAINVLVGGNNEKIPGVPIAATVNT